MQLHEEHKGSQPHLLRQLLGSEQKRNSAQLAPHEIGVDPTYRVPHHGHHPPLRLIPK
jgi:hypothetical protein